MKICPRCKINRQNSHFHKNRAKASGLHSYCKECNRARHLAWTRKNPDKAISNQRAYMLRRIYGITNEIYEELLAKQNGCCAICLKHHTSFKKKLAVEHNHRTKEIRGLCCTYCNRGLAAYHDKAEYFQRAADYLNQGTGLFVPENKKKPKRYRNKEEQ